MVGSGLRVFQIRDSGIFDARWAQLTLRQSKYLTRSVIASSCPPRGHRNDGRAAPLSPPSRPRLLPRRPRLPLHRRHRLPGPAAAAVIFPCDARGESASRWQAGPQGSPAGLERARRGRPCGARSRMPSAGRGSAGRPRGITLRRRAASLRPAVRRGIPVIGPAEVQVRGGRPPGEGARGEDGRARTSSGSAGRHAEKA